MATSVAVPAVERPRRPSIARYFGWSIDHKVIGIQYIVTCFFFFLVGGTLAELIRIKLLTPGPSLVADGPVYNSLFTIHATVMVFLFVIPVFAGFGNYLVPLMIG